MVGNPGAVAAVMKQRGRNGNVAFRRNNMIEGNQQTCVGTILIFITILFIANFIMDLFKVSSTSHWVEERHNESEYFGYSSKRDNLKYEAINYMNRFRFITMFV